MQAHGALNNDTSMVAEKDNPLKKSEPVDDQLEAVEAGVPNIGERRRDRRVQQTKEGGDKHDQADDRGSNKKL
ncbi:hypothetical protein A0H81_12065 [Grifola frondosa]|uniref:Uncharacterized protein n=1 Tax=Grifola frondosa TaxID=5627 RepID=A0A1C7LV91_GRIFR|nr:hypothetical protein A0H81_12065 [Grifola frondosa]